MLPKLMLGFVSNPLTHSDIIKNNHELALHPFWEERICRRCVPCDDQLVLATLPKQWLVLRSSSFRPNYVMLCCRHLHRRATSNEKQYACCLTPRAVDVGDCRFAAENSDQKALDNSITF